MSKAKYFCVGFLAFLINGMVLGQATEPSTQPDYLQQESALAGKILADNDRLIASSAAEDATQKDFDADSTQLRDLLGSEISEADAGIAADRITLFLQEPTQNGERTCSHPQILPPPTSAMTVWGGADVDVINVQDIWFVIDGGGTIHVSATKPSGLDLSTASSEWEYPADKHVHIDPADLFGRINALHRKIHWAANLYPENAEEFYTSTILFRNERAQYNTTTSDELPPSSYGGDTNAAFVNGHPIAENGSYYGEISKVNGLPRTHYINGYYRADGSYVRSYYRSR